jgi:hypothetical protein
LPDSSHNACQSVHDKSKKLVQTVRDMRGGSFVRFATEDCNGVKNVAATHAPSVTRSII